MSLRQEQGYQIEQQACLYLQARGFSLLEKNYHCYFGEIDLIMQDQQDIVFVEVRSRTSISFGHPLESITPSKINKLAKTATYFLQKKQWLYKVNSRFDVVTAQLSAGQWQFEWLKNAFTVEGW
ncbi:MAG TPA: YraN family protein [Gammaproteobacteria bacterium]|jgi:putative endonuclease|nr:YraN family protein [Gammaproteobacteria bacterium]